MLNTVNKSIKQGNALRLDPKNFPQHVFWVCYHSKNGKIAVINEKNVVVLQFLSFKNIPVFIQLPITVFKGIAVRIISRNNDRITMRVELYHQDPNFCIPLLISENLPEVAQDWKLWSQIYNLPMLMIEENGDVISFNSENSESTPYEGKEQKHIPARQEVLTPPVLQGFFICRSIYKLGLNLRIKGKKMIISL
ncbi:hypothetical protein B488_08200 [Liberibacter crescens BT-1]|uniref:Uncharacterized protein n=1 Tax=Liberibacter crescens (strain BT-1) TaxID=1215343 RepID=L0EV23_LIBCB|nr:DUF6101 family protein [Liberibacter crescens]AGA64812.1 hypothetical protein B488_08200 [Liberibacter crescens BT-1]AMC12870.1 hypothetical protein RL73_04145 [Liberibacter crescens]